MRSFGDAYYSDVTVGHSYGYKTPVTNLDWNGEVAYFIGPPGSLGGFSNGVWDSYGKSPISNYSSYACCVWSFGIIGSDHYVSNDSYGRIYFRRALKAGM